MIQDLSKKAAIVGVGRTEMTNHEGRSAMSLYLEAIVRAMEDAGLKKKDLDGFLVYPPNGGMRFHTEMTEQLGSQNFAKTMCDFPLVGGLMVGLALNKARAAVYNGLCKNVVVVGGGTWRSSSHQTSIGLSGVDLSNSVYHGREPISMEFEFPYGVHLPALAAMVTQRHMKEFGTTSEQLAAIAVACRKHAALNERALLRNPITVADVVNSKMIAEPLHLLDCSYIADGASAFIVTSQERARDTQDPVWILGVGQAQSYYHMGHLCHGGDGFDLVHTVGKRAAEQAFAEAGLGPTDVDVAELNDSFTTTVLLQLEDYGFCKKGEAGAFVADGRLELGGALPLNTHGGLLSEGDSGLGNSLPCVVEAVTQLRHDARARQVEGAEVAMVSGVSETLSSYSVALLGRN
ncbi:MAG: thiolase family protein [Dehalococcoidia bacterium]|nr:thiolase family protein [Dehalococcoidia bacterium]